MPSGDGGNSFFPLFHIDSTSAYFGSFFFCVCLRCFQKLDVTAIEVNRF
jgi:hypothetical protein